MRYYSLVVGPHNGDEPGDCAGKELKNVLQWMDLNAYKSVTVLGRLKELGIKGTSEQLSKALHGRLNLTIQAEIRLMEMVDAGTPEELTRPAHDPEMAAKIKAIYKRNLSA